MELPFGRGQRFKVPIRKYDMSRRPRAKHGTPSMYCKGCRCRPCRQGQSAANYKWTVNQRNKLRAELDRKIKEIYGN